MAGQRRRSRHELRPGAIAIQAAVLAIVLLLGTYLVHNTLVNMARQGIATGFGYLGREAAFEIGETLIPYSPADSYGRALLVGLLNTLQVAIIGIVVSTVLGTLIGIARLSGNWLVRKLAWAYVEILRNVPLLLQLIVWWDLLRVAAPPPRAAWQILPHIFVSNRGLVFPTLIWSPVYLWMGVALMAALAAARIVARGKKRAAALALILPLALFLLAGAPLAWEVPELQGFNFSGGHTLSPELAALLVGLIVYTAAFIAEIVRSGIEGVSRGQSEAAAALGLNRRQALRLVILPQALRIVIPPLIGEYLALTKNSSLAIAIGYPDLTAITYTTLNQTGQAVEAIALMMAIYLALSLATSLIMNWYNARVALVER
ncbi:MAG TPA: ABC transporter permease subunit [Stellaceae bacterium]|nr:ABC transporter permease subunit [Stellaceae bacterium]